MFTKIRQQAYKILLLQFATISLLTIMVFFFKDLKSGYSIFLGGLAYIIPSIFFIKKAFPSLNNNRSPAKMLADFYLGELIKLTLSIILLFLLFKLIPVKIIFLISGYILACLALLFLPLVFSF